MPTNIPAREVPFPSSFALTAASASKEDKEVEEPALRVDQIQGNILAGFNKDNQTLIFLRIEDPKQFKKWLQTVVPFVAMTEEVLLFNYLFIEIRSRSWVETRLDTCTSIYCASY